MSLHHFLSVRNGEKTSRFLRARTIATDKIRDGWSHHDRSVNRLKREETTDRVSLFIPEYSLLDLKIDLARQVYQACDLCPHACAINRLKGEVGYCGVAEKSAVHWEGILHGEEIALVPSHEVFFSGCTMRCAFCYSHEHITKPMSGVTVSSDELAKCGESRFAQGATNLNFVGGEPTVHLLSVLQALKTMNVPMPIVWNSNMYITAHTMRLLDGIVDLFLGDIHFGNNDCARHLGRIPSYFETVTHALQSAVESGASVIIRHLLMPGHLECCARPAMEWAQSTLPETPFHLMYQYVPDYRAIGDPVLGRILTQEEIMEAKAMALDIGVYLYEEKPEEQNLSRTPSSTAVSLEFIGDNVDILIHGDGRVVFTRLTDELLPVLAALNSEERVQMRSGTVRFKSAR